MNDKEFQNVVDTTLDQIRSTLAAKGAEYVPDNAVSRFHNFELAAALNEQLSTEALWGFLTKHIVSLSDMVKIEPCESTLGKWDEKINDAIVYLLLLKGIVTEAHDRPITTEKGMKSIFSEKFHKVEDETQIVINVSNPVLPPMAVHTNDNKLSKSKY